MYYEPYEYERPRRWRLAAAGGAAALVLLASFALWQLRSGSEPDDAATAEATASTTVADEPTTSTPASGPSTSAPTSIVDRASESPGAQVTDTANVEGDPSVTITSATNVPLGPEGPALGYPTSPDGTPLPLVVVYDVETTTISGQVPSRAAKDRLAVLAVANSQFPEAQLVDNMVINSEVPISVGVRVIELNSARFPEATAEIRPDHALELDRVVAIMQALPQISVLVIGHADQRGDDLANFAISDERARAVVNYLLYLGVSQTRLASRAAGESDLLTLGDDDASLALNRRTEFIFYGLLIE